MPPLLYREFLKYATPAQRLKMEAMTLIDGEGAMGRIMVDSYAVLEQLPAFIAPYEQVWIELGKMTISGFERGHYAGVIVTCVDVRNEKSVVDGQAIGWLLSTECYIDTIPAEARTYLGRLDMVLTDKGKLPDHPNGGFAVGEMTINAHMESMLAAAVLQQEKRTDLDQFKVEVEYGIRRLIESCAMSALFVLGLLNCKNVELTEVVVSRKALRHRLKHGKSTDERFYTLKVTGKGARAGSMALRVPSGQRNAMHWCRGHLRTYTDDAPLFGRITGTFWVDAHIRGNRGEGVVSKDYQVDMTRPLPATHEG